MLLHFTAAFRRPKSDYLRRLRAPMSSSISCSQLNDRALRYTVRDVASRVGFVAIANLLIALPSPFPWHPHGHPCHHTSKTPPRLLLTALNISPPCDVFVEYRAQQRHSPTLQGYTAPFLFGITALEETAVDQQVANRNLPKVVTCVFW